MDNSFFFDFIEKYNSHEMPLEHFVAFFKKKDIETSMDIKVLYHVKYKLHYIIPKSDTILYDRFSKLNEIEKIFYYTNIKDVYISGMIYNQAVVFDDKFEICVFATAINNYKFAYNYKGEVYCFDSSKENIWLFSNDTKNFLFFFLKFSEICRLYYDKNILDQIALKALKLNNSLNQDCIDEFINTLRLTTYRSNSAEVLPKGNRKLIIKRRS
jgi:hypothetical protein